jgi:hypothetical protein
MGRRLAFGAAVLLAAAWLLPPSAAGRLSPPEHVRLEHAMGAVTLHPAPVTRSAASNARQPIDQWSVVVAGLMLGTAVVVGSSLRERDGQHLREWWRFVMSRRGPPAVARFV